MAETVASGDMNVRQLEHYIATLFERQAEFGEHYVRRQVEWADAELERKLAQGETHV